MTGLTYDSGKLSPSPLVNHFVNRSFVPGFAACVSLLFALGCPLSADVKIPHGSGRPQAKPVTVSVMRGGENWIGLSAATNSLKLLEFVIRSEPKHGKLGEQVRDPEATFRVSVPYTPPADLGITEDEFTYAAKIPGVAVSETVAVKILILEAMYQLQQIGKLVLEVDIILWKKILVSLASIFFEIYIVGKCV